MRDTNNFAPTTKDCTALELRSSKFEFTLMRPTVRIYLCAGWQRSLLEAFSCCSDRLSHRSFHQRFLCLAGTTDRDASVSSNPVARAHEAAGDSSSSKRGKENSGEMFETTKHFCSSPGYCVREARVVCQPADAIKLKFRNRLGAFELMCSAGDWIKNGFVGRRRNVPRQTHAGVRQPYRIVSWR